MKKTVSLLLCGACIAARGLNAEARGGGGGGFGGGSGFGHPSGPGSNSAASDNANGKFSQDRDSGLDRAEDRMSSEGLAHEKASDAKSKRKTTQGSDLPAQLPAR